MVALTKVKNAWAAANLKVATTLGITTAASKALMFTGIGVVIAGVAALISVYSKWKTKQDEKNKALEEEKRIQAELSKQISDSFGKEMAKIEAMRAALNSENISRSKKLDIVKRLRDQIPGYTAELNKEGNVIRENKKAIDDYMASLEKSLKLRAAEKELEELYSKAYAIESDPEFQKKKQSEKNANEVANIIRQAEGLEPVFWEHTTPELDDIKKRAETIKDYISSNGLSTIIKAEASKAAKEQSNAANALQKQILALQAQTANLQLEQMQESLQKRLAQIDAEEKRCRRLPKMSRQSSKRTIRRIRTMRDSRQPLPLHKLVSAPQI